MNLVDGKVVNKSSCVQTMLLCCLFLQHRDVSDNLKSAEQALSYLDNKIERIRQVATSFQSADSDMYKMPQLRTVFGERAFSHASPAVWNSLPASVQASTNTTSFFLLKTHFFNLAFTS